jgi:hypothetical protein
MSTYSRAVMSADLLPDYGPWASASTITIW